MQKFNVTDKAPKNNTMVYVWLNGEPYTMRDSQGNEYLLPMVADDSYQEEPEEPYDFFDMLEEESVSSRDGYDINTDTLEWAYVDENYTLSIYNKELRKADKYYRNTSNTHIWDKINYFINNTKLKLVKI